MPSIQRPVPHPWLTQSSTLSQRPLRRVYPVWQAAQVDDAPLVQVDAEHAETVLGRQEVHAFVPSP